MPHFSIHFLTTVLNGTCSLPTIAIHQLSEEISNELFRLVANLLGWLQATNCFLLTLLPEDFNFDVPMECLHFDPHLDPYLSSAYRMVSNLN